MFIALSTTNVDFIKYSPTNVQSRNILNDLKNTSNIF